MVMGTASAQNYYDHWAFGTSVHIDFTSGSPVPACNVSINSSEAAAVWSNPVTGAFIAYTNGNIVYNGQNNNVLANGTGLTANASSIESALILPKPGATLDEFYIFHNNITNCYWSLADMSVGTNGTVMSKNNFLQATGSERCGTAPHGTICPAYWLMISKSGNDSVAAYLIDTNGISSTPVVTPTGISGGNARGNIVFSEDFTKIGMSVENKGMYVANFNNVTGQTSNWTKIGSTTNGFGSAFSPDGTKIYYTSGYGQSLFQYNFSNSTQTSLGGTGLSYLALAPDGKIYISKYGQQTLGVINSPNSAGTASNFQISGITISNSSTCLCRWGLPNPFHVDIGYHPTQPDTITLCPGEDTLYTSPVNGDYYYWNTGDTTQSILLDSAGLYYATIGFGDCSSSDSVYLQFADEVSIEATTVCLSDSTTFSHSTNMPAANIVSYDWNFGDGNTSSLANPLHLYNSGDTFTVTFELETQTGCVLDTFMEVVVHPNPVPAFSFDNVCDGESVQFQDQSQAGSAPIVSRSWDVTNDGTTDYASLNPTHAYNTFGTYAVEYKVTDGLGCTDSMVKLAHIHPIPSADFDMLNQCLGVSHEFHDSSEVALGGIVSWLWEFGDGDSSVAQHPTHEFSTAGTKTITLTVWSDSGCVDQHVKNTITYHLPVADFHADSVCENVDANFNNASTTNSGVVTQYWWEFGDGENTVVASPDHRYDDPGLYEVSLAVKTNVGCRDSVTKNIRIYPAPVTAFAWSNNVCEGEDLPFFDQSQIQQVTPGGDQITQWDWTINGAPFSSDQHPIYTTNSYESLTIRLVTTSNYGCTTWSENTAQVFPNPTASMVIDPACQHYVTQLRSTSTIPHGLVSQWQWDLGDGSTSDTARVSHTYDQYGTFPIRLTVWSNKGCVDSTTGAVSILETPRVDFSAAPLRGCSDLLTQLVNASELSSGSMTYEWKVEGRAIGTDKHESTLLHNDSIAPQKFDVRLKATSDQGCAASLLRSDYITVLPKPDAKFVIDQDVNAMFDPAVTFTNFSRHGVRWLWEFGDGQQSEEFQPVHTYEKHGEYVAHLTTWNTYDCADTMSHYLLIDPVTLMYIPSAFTPDNDGDNDTWFVRGYNEGNQFEVRIWDRWGQLLFESNDINFEWDGYVNGELAPLGNYVYQIIYETSDGHPTETTGRINLMR